MVTMTTRAMSAAIDARVREPDVELLARWRRGDGRAGHELFSRHFAGVYRFLERKVGGAADDLVRRAFLAAVREPLPPAGVPSVAAILFRHARVELYRWLRQLHAEAAVDFETASIDAALSGSSPPSGGPDTARAGSSRPVRAPDTRGVRDRLRELPLAQQLLLELRYWHQLDVSSLAVAFDATVPIIHDRLVRARQALRARIDRRS